MLSSNMRRQGRSSVVLGPAWSQWGLNDLRESLGSVKQNFL